jgi:hypothetical protein
MMSKIARFFIACPENNYCPPVLSYRAFLVYGLILLILRIILGTLPAKTAAVESQRLMELVNEERQNRNLPTLYAHQSLVLAATEKSQDMIDRDYFAHIDPDGNYVWPRIEAAGYYPYKTLGENLALDFSTSEGMIKAWIDSPTHRANLLNPDFADQGLSALYGDFQGRYTNLTTSLFGTLAKVTKRTVEVKAEPPPSSPPVTEQEHPPSPEIEHAPTSTAEKTAPSGLKPRETPGNAALPLLRGELPAPNLAAKINPALYWSRIIFTLFGIILLLLLSIDSVIIYRHELEFLRSKPSYHFFGFMLIVLVSILIWWW